MHTLLPDSIRRRLAGLKHMVLSPPVGRVQFGDLQRTQPVSRVFGYDRGLPVDRYYIEGFLERSSADVKGRVLEIGDNAYTLRFGGAKLEKSDVLHVHEGNPQATFVGDLTTADHIPGDLFDCVILTQTLHLIYDFRAALSTVRRILKPGGVLLATVPGISQIDAGEWGGTWYWAFTDLSVRGLFGEYFPSTEVTAHGNVLVATSFLHGLAVSELTREELDYQDPCYQVLLTIRAIKPAV